MNPGGAALNPRRRRPLIISIVYLIVWLIKTQKQTIAKKQMHRQLGRFHDVKQPEGWVREKKNIIKHWKTN